MSRSGYNDDSNGWEFIRWRGAVNAALRGKRGQAFLKELLAALDAMPEKRLIADDLERNGEVCAIGALGRSRCIDMSKLDPEDGDAVAAQFGIARALALETVYINDEHWMAETPEERWRRVRAWVAEQIWNGQSQL